MEKIFSDIIKIVVIFFGGKLCGYFCLGILISAILVFTIQLVYSIKTLKPSNSAYTKFAVYVVATSLIVSICEYLVTRKIFVNIYVIGIYFLFCFLLAFSFALILYQLDKQLLLKSKNSKQKPVYSLENDQILKTTSATKRAIMHLKENKQSDTTMYIDVGYIKELISLVKQKELPIEEENELEEFEIYLMNFCQKQPTVEEKSKLSLYLSSLMKKLAYYKIVC